MKVSHKSVSDGVEQENAQQDKLALRHSSVSVVNEELMRHCSAVVCGTDRPQRPQQGVITPERCRGADETVSDDETASDDDLLAINYMFDRVGESKM